MRVGIFGLLSIGTKFRPPRLFSQQFMFLAIGSKLRQHWPTNIVASCKISVLPPAPIEEEKHKRKQKHAQCDPDPNAG
jgi:hypothetical protein